MRSISIIMVAVVMAAFCKPNNYNNIRKELNNTADSNGFAVIELFTSEGCSSCPPADKLVEKIQRENQNKPIYILAFHVDYWNYMGWKDAFSDAAFTARQRRYADWLHLETVYTPQIVVNGKSEYVGSDERSITKAVDRELGQLSTGTLTLHAAVESGKVKIDYTAHAEKNAELVLALVQRSAQSNVRAGENAGKQLSHVQIVRQLVHQDVNSKKAITIDLPNDFKATDWELIGFVQHNRDGHITAAAKFNFQS